MPKSSRRVPRLAWLLPLALVAAVTGCSSDKATGPDKLCGSGTGLAARVSGTPDPIEMCLPQDSVLVTLGVLDPDRYDISGTFTSGGITIEIIVSFTIHSNLPASLNLTTNQAQALSDPDGAWFVYREKKPGEYDYSSRTVSGTFTLTFSDPTVAVATFSSLKIDLEDGNGTITGSRTISEGFVSVLPD